MENEYSAGETFNKYAKLYEEKFMHFDLYNDTYDALCRLLPQAGARLLEVGCGPGNISRYLLDRIPGLRIHGIDIAENMIALAQANIPEGNFEVKDGRRLSELSGPYDAVVAGFCLPYFSKQETETFLAGSASLLAQDGLFYSSVMEGPHSASGWKASSNGKDKTFVYYYEEAYLVSELEKLGLVPQEIFRRNYQEASGAEQTHLIVIAKKTT